MPCLRDFLLGEKWYYQCFIAFFCKILIPRFAFAFESLYFLSMYCASVYKMYTFPITSSRSGQSWKSCNSQKMCTDFFHHNYLFVYKIWCLYSSLPIKLEWVVQNVVSGEINLHNIMGYILWLPVHWAPRCTLCIYLCQLAKLTLLTSPAMCFMW